MFSVVCPDFHKDGFKSREDAEAWMRRVDDFGQCHHDHDIHISCSRCGWTFDGVCEDGLCWQCHDDVQSTSSGVNRG